MSAKQASAPRIPNSAKAKTYAGIWKSHLDEADRTASKMIDFFHAYERLAERGKCDSPGGMECRRVLTEWIALGCSEKPEAFIARRANAID